MSIVCALYVVFPVSIASWAPMGGAGDNFAHAAAAHPTNFVQSLWILQPARRAKPSLKLRGGYIDERARGKPAPSRSRRNIFGRGQSGTKTRKDSMKGSMEDSDCVWSSSPGRRPSAGEGEIVFDMRTADEIAMAGPKEEPIEEHSNFSSVEADTYPISARTAKVREWTRELIPDLIEACPDLNATADDLLKIVREIEGHHTAVTELVDAAAANDIDDIETIMAAGNVSVDGIDASGFSPLMRAAVEGAVEAVCVLLQHGADTEIRDEEGWTALHHACRAGQPLVVEVLLRSGAEPDVYANLEPMPGENSTFGGQGASPLHLARRWMDRATPKEHPLYDPRGGDAYWRIEQMLLEFGATQWLAPTADNPWKQQSVRPIDDCDGTLQKEVFCEPLTDEEKFQIEPEYFRPQNIIMRRMMQDGILPDDKNLLTIARSVYGYIPTEADKAAAREAADARRPVSNELARIAVAHAQEGRGTEGGNTGARQGKGQVKAGDTRGLRNFVDGQKRRGAERGAEQDGGMRAPRSNRNHTERSVQDKGGAGEAEAAKHKSSDDGTQQRKTKVVVVKRKKKAPAQLQTPPAVSQDQPSSQRRP